MEINDVKVSLLTCCRNYAIGYYLKSKGCLNENVNLKETLELYFQMCSIETSIKNASIMAGR